MKTWQALKAADDSRSLRPIQHPSFDTKKLLCGTSRYAERRQIISLPAKVSFD